MHLERMQCFRVLNQATQRNLQKVFSGQVIYYNLQRRDVLYEVGQQVLKQIHILSSKANTVATKLSPKYEGPFVSWIQYVRDSVDRVVEKANCSCQIFEGTP